jgi:hypothetical protein
MLMSLAFVLAGCSAWDWTCLGLDIADVVLNPSDPNYSSCYYSSYGWYGDDDDDHEDSQPEDKADVETIKISIEGDTRKIEYNKDTYEAQLEVSTGEYGFAPDPDGLITGASIDCTATIDELQFTGQCFRDGLMCSFSYQRDAADPEDVYTLIASSCEEKDGLGAFSIPENSPSASP